MEEYSFLDYQLPEERIAQRPIGKGDERSNSKLLRVCSADSQIQIGDHYFSDLPKFLKAGDLLVFNNTKVIPCRYFISTGKDLSDVEVLLIRRSPINDNSNIWEAMARPMKRLKEGIVYQLSADITCIPIGRNSDGSRIFLEITGDVNSMNGTGALMPIPPYIRGGYADIEDRESYQTVYAENPGSIAAPTAGFHFTKVLLQEIESIGCKCCYLTLHVSAASFTPIRDCDVKSHIMTSENYEIPPQTLTQIYKAKNEGRRIVVVGTTTLRALESAVRTADYAFLDGSDEHFLIEKFTNSKLMETNLFIKPGFYFRIADVLITNFHQPRSTHLLLVAAFIGEAPVRAVYQHALNSNYRFLSYGDAMILFPQKQK